MGRYQVKFSSLLDIGTPNCFDLTSAGGATYQMVEAGVELDVSCYDCSVFHLSAQFVEDGYTHTVGKIWIEPTGPNPQLIVVGK